MTMFQNMFVGEGDAVAPLRYFDDEGDLVSINSDDELAEAHRLLVTDASKCLRLYLGDAVPAAAPAPSAAPAPTLSFPAIPQFKHGLQAGVTTLQNHVNTATAALPAMPALPTVDQVQQKVNDTQNTIKTQMREIDWLKQITDELESISAMVSEKYDEAEVEKKFRDLSRKLDEGVQSASVAASDKVQSVKTFIGTHTDEKLLLQIQNIRAQILALTTSMHQNFIAPLLQNVQDAIQKQLDMSYPSTFVPSANVKKETTPEPEPKTEAKTSTLPADAARKDLEQLASMGFHDREQNIKLLLKNKGDVIAVVEELLATASQ